MTYTHAQRTQGHRRTERLDFADQSFTYDAGFNRATWVLGGTTTSYTANNLNEYTAVSGSTAPTWNSDGGLHVFAGNTYTYDALSRLTEVDNSSNKCYFSYDPFGRRVKKVVKDSTGTTTLATYGYHYDGSQVAVEYRDESPTGSIWTYYLGPGMGQPVMRVHNVVPIKQWYYRDGQGSVSAVADNTGNLIEAYEYNAQGQFEILDSGGSVLSSTGIHNDLMYGGYRYDPETSNYFCNARYYNPTLGRFISRDPLSGAEFSQGTNLYAYCENDYDNATDPSGEGGHWLYTNVGPQSIWMGNLEWIPNASAAVSTTGPQSTINTSGKGMVWSAGGGFFFGPGGEGGVELVTLSNGLRQWYVYAGVGVGAQLSAGVQAGVVNHVYVPSDYSKWFWTGQTGLGVTGATGAVTPTAPISGANSQSFGPGTGADAGASTSMRYYLPVGPSF